MEFWEHTYQAGEVAVTYSSFRAKPSRKLLTIYQWFMGQPLGVKCKILHMKRITGAEIPSDEINLRPTLPPLAARPGCSSSSR